MPKLHLKDIDLYYEITGQGKPVLLIHGLGSSTKEWESQIDFFAQDYQVIAFDVRGHGKSEKPAGPYSVARFADDTAELLRSLCSEPAHVVGISMGGMIAFQLALDAPELVKSLTIVNSAPEMRVKSFKEKKGALIRKLTVKIFGVGRMGKVLAKRLFPNDDQEFFRIQLAERWAENDKKPYLDSFNAIVNWSVMDRVGLIRCPVFIVAAEHDYTPISFKEEYAAKIMDSEVKVIANSRHLTPTDSPVAFNLVVKAFLDKQVEEQAEEQVDN